MEPSTTPLGTLGSTAGQADRSEAHVAAADQTGRKPPPLTYSDAVVRLEEAEDALRAIGAGEVDAFVVLDGASERRVFTLSTADRPYRRFVEDMREGAATLSPTGVILYANRRLAELLSCSQGDILGARLTAFMGSDVVDGWESTRGFDGVGATLE